MSEPAYPAATTYRGVVATQYVAERRGPIWEWEDQQVRRFVESAAGPRAVLDLPVGTGRYLTTYLDAGWTVHAGDISADMVDIARAEVGERASACHFFVAPAESIPLPDASVDVIVSGRFIQWLPTLDDVDRVLAEFARVGRSELFVQLRLPARPSSSPGDALRYLASTAKRRLRTLRGRPVLTSQRESALIEVAGRHGWELAVIGQECPVAPGVRFYRFVR